MNKFTKKQILIGALILLFVINIAALGTIIYQNYQHKWKQPSFPVEKPDWSQRERDSRLGAGRDKEKWPARKDSLNKKGSQQKERGFEYFIKRKLDLDEEQFRKFQTLHNENMETMKKIARELGQKQEVLMKELTKEKPDSNKMKRLAGEIGDLHTQLKINTVEHFSRMKELCNPEQRGKLNQMIMEMAKHGRHHAEPGAGMTEGGAPHSKRFRK
ncbi:MAG: Spy/CpxP family protein refolding chaperone [Bacteroidales bacterium]